MRRLAHRKHYTSTFRHMACGPTDGHTHMVLVDPAASHGREARRSPLIRLQITEHSTQSTAGEEKNKKKYLSVWVASRLFSYSRGLKKKSIAKSTRAVFPQCRRRNGSLHNIHKTILCFLKTKCHDSNNNKELCSHGSFCAKMQLNVLRQSKTGAENID